MNTFFQNKTALITGSTSGIGLGIAKGLAAEGTNLMLNGFATSGEVSELKAMLSQEYGVRVAYGGADMTRPNEIRELVAQTQAEFGAVDILVNNAGIQHVAPIDEFAEDKWDAILAINLSSSFHTIKAALPGMKQRGWGRIMNVASVHGLVASPYKSAYVAAKHGLIGLTKTVALECAGFDITCNAICPGYVHTPIVENQINDQAKAHGLSREQVISQVILASQPKKQFIELAQVAAMTVFLCGPQASAVTGSSFTIDGGWTAR